MPDYEAIIKEMIDQAESRLERDRDNLNKALEQYGDDTPVYTIVYFSHAMERATSEIQILQRVLRRGEGFD